VHQSKQGPFSVDHLFASSLSITLIVFFCTLNNGISVLAALFFYFANGMS